MGERQPETLPHGLEVKNKKQSFISYAAVGTGEAEMVPESR
jgi:hypothetical protein